MQQIFEEFYSKKIPHFPLSGFLETHQRHSWNSRHGRRRKYLHRYPPRYRIYENGVFTKEITDASQYWKEGYVGFLIGCSFSFEEALIREGIEVRHIAQGRNVPMFKTSIQTVPVGPFSGPMVCSMRPMTPEMQRKPMRSLKKCQMFMAPLQSSKGNDAEWYPSACKSGGNQSEQLSSKHDAYFWRHVL